MNTITVAASARPRAWLPGAAQRQAPHYHRLGELAQALSNHLGSGALVWHGPNSCPWWAAAYVPHDSDREFLLQSGALGAIAVVPLSDRRRYPSHQPLAELVAFIVQQNQWLSLHALGRFTNGI